MWSTREQINLLTYSSTEIISQDIKNLWSTPCGTCNLPAVPLEPAVGVLFMDPPALLPHFQTPPTLHFVGVDRLVVLRGSNLQNHMECQHSCIKAVLWNFSLYKWKHIYQSCTYLWQMTLKLTIRLKRFGGSKSTIHVTKAFEQIAMCMQHVLVLYM